MSKRALTPAEKSIIERELIEREHIRARRKKIENWIFWLSLSFAIIAAITFRLRGFHWYSFAARILWIAGLATYFFYLGSPSILSRKIDGKHINNPWLPYLSELKETRHIIRGAILLSSFMLARIACNMLWMTLS